MNDRIGGTNLGETDVGGLLTEALTADVHLESVLARVHFACCIWKMQLVRGCPYAVLADQTGAVRADTAEGAQLLAFPFLISSGSSPPLRQNIAFRLRLSSGELIGVYTPFAGALAVPEREIG